MKIAIYKCEIRTTGTQNSHEWDLLQWEQDSSPTRQFTDTVFGDSSPTELKTVHRHF